MMSESGGPVVVLRARRYLFICFVACLAMVAGLVTATAQPAAAQDDVTANPRVIAWGDNVDGEIGLNDAWQPTYSWPTPPSAVYTGGALSGVDILATSAGEDHSCAISTAGKTYCWGSNINGRLGTMGSAYARAPEKVHDTDRSYQVWFGTVSRPGYLENKIVTSLSAGWRHTCVATADGKAFCWGGNSYGELGVKTVPNTADCNRSSTDKSCWEPVPVFTGGALSGKQVTKVAAGGFHTCAMTSDGSAYCWGAGAQGQLGNGQSGNYAWTAEPVAVTGLPGRVVDISSGYEHSCAVIEGGSVVCWGDNSYGQLGDGATWFVSGAKQTVPTSVSTATSLADKSVSALSAGYRHTCVATSDGTAHCWGNNANGQLGTNSRTSRTSPVAVLTSGVLSNKSVVQVAAGFFNTCARTLDGTVACWGGNHGTPPNYTEVLAPAAPNPVGALAGRLKVTDVSAGRRHVLTVAAETTPAAPRNVSASVGDRQVTLTFTPGANGGLAITNYEYSLNGGTTWTPFNPTDITSPVTITGLTNGTTYTIALRALNALGAGAASSTVEATPATTPQPPTALTANPANGAATVTFTPGNDGGSAITNYEYTLNGGTTWTPFNPTLTTSPATITGLTNGTAYTIALRALNAQGTSTASASTTVTPKTVPDPPTGLGVSVGDRQVTLTFTPGATGGSAITNYEYTLNGGTTWTPFNPTLTTSPATITGLTNGTTYSIALRALNDAGAGAASGVVPAKPVTLPSAPENVTARAGNGNTDIWFTAGDSGGSAVTNYEYTLDGGATWNAADPATTSTPVSISGLTNGQSYSVALRAVTEVGVSARSATASVTPDQFAPVSLSTGDSTRLGLPTGIDAFADGRLAVVNLASRDFGGMVVPEGSGHTVSVYPAGMNGTTSPMRTIGGNQTGLVRPHDVAVLASGSLAVTDPISNEVLIYAPEANGNVAPVRRISGPQTGLTSPTGIAQLSTGDIAVLTGGANPAIVIFNPEASGDAAPARMVAGPATGLQSTAGITALASGEIAVATTTSVLIFDAGAQGDATPVRTIAGPNTGLANAYDVVALGTGELAVIDYGSPGMAMGITASPDSAVRYYPAGANGNVAPSRVLTADVSQLRAPMAGVGLPGGGLVVTNALCAVSSCLKGSLLEFAAYEPPPPPPTSLVVNVRSTGFDEAYDGVEVGVAINGGPFTYRTGTTNAEGTIDFGDIDPYATYRVQLKAPCDHRPVETETAFTVTTGEVTEDYTLIATVPCAPTMTYRPGDDTITWTTPNDGGSALRYYTFHYNTPARLNRGKAWAIFARYWPADINEVPLRTHGPKNGPCPARSTQASPMPYNVSPQCLRPLANQYKTQNVRYRIAARNAVSTPGVATSNGPGWSPYSTHLTAQRSSP